jgi:YggT family protein
MDIVKSVLAGVLYLYLLILIVRMIFSWIQAFSHSWHPTGIILVIAEVAYTATDPPLRFLRRYIPSVRLGTVALDLSFMLLFVVVWIAAQAVQLI